MQCYFYPRFLDNYARSSFFGYFAIHTFEKWASHWKYEKPFGQLTAWQMSRPPEKLCNYNPVSKQYRENGTATRFPKSHSLLDSINLLSFLSLNENSAPHSQSSFCSKFDRRVESVKQVSQPFPIFWIYHRWLCSAIERPGWTRKILQPRIVDLRKSMRGSFIAWRRHLGLIWFSCLLSLYSWLLLDGTFDSFCFSPASTLLQELLSVL
jgi:hypothetical protein